MVPASPKAERGSIVSVAILVMIFDLASKQLERSERMIYWQNEAARLKEETVGAEMTMFYHFRGGVFQAPRIYN